MDTLLLSQKFQQWFALTNNIVTLCNANLTTDALTNLQTNLKDNLVNAINEVLTGSVSKTGDSTVAGDITAVELLGSTSISIGSTGQEGLLKFYDTVDNVYRKFKFDSTTQKWQAENASGDYQNIMYEGENLDASSFILTLKQMSEPSLAVYTGTKSELVYDTTNNLLFCMDGTTPGGFKLVRNTSWQYNKIATWDASGNLIDSGTSVVGVLNNNSSIGDLADVTITGTPADGESLVYQNGILVNQTIDGVPFIAAGGTADAITANFTPDLGLKDGRLIYIRAVGANTVTTPTIAVDGGDPLTIYKAGHQALAAGDIPAAGAIVLLQYTLSDTSWELINPAGASGTSFTTFKYLATAGQTVFSGVDSNALTLAYIAENILVFINGTLMDKTDYTATDGTSITLGDAASLNDEVVIQALKALSIANTYTKAEVDSLVVNKVNLRTFKYLATAGQTIFTGLDSSSQTLAYTAGSILVFANGICLDHSDYTATNGTSITLGVARVLNDEIVIHAIGTFQVADTYAKDEVYNKTESYSQTQTNTLFTDFPATVHSWSKTQSSTQVSLTSASAHIATNCALSNTFTHTLTESTTLDNPTNIVAGTDYKWTFTQHASAAKTLALGNYFKTTDGKAFVGLPTTVGSICTLFAYAETSTRLVVSMPKEGQT